MSVLGFTGEPQHQNSPATTEEQAQRFIPRGPIRAEAKMKTRESLHCWGCNPAQLTPPACALQAHGRRELSGAEVSREASCTFPAPPRDDWHALANARIAAMNTVSEFERIGR